MIKYITMDQSISSNQQLQILLLKEVQKRGMFGHHTDSFNAFLRKGIKQILTNVFVIETTVKNERSKTDEDAVIDKIHIRVDIDDAKVLPPTMSKTNSKTVLMMTPTLARLNNLTYSGPLMLNATITATAYMKDGTTKVRTEQIQDFRATNIPIMVGSECCNTYKKPEHVLKMMKHDHTDEGGYFICKSNEWVINGVESLTFNSFHVYKNIGHRDEVCHGDFISKPGDGFENSAELIIKLLTNGNLVFEITNIKLKDVSFPFYVIFRALGVESDLEIVEHICYGMTGTVSQHLQQVLELAFNSSYKSMDGARDIHDKLEMLTFMAANISAINKNFQNRDDNTLKYFNSNIVNLLDRYLLPHVGLLPEHRRDKIRYLGHLVNKLLMVEYGIVDSTDRDSYKNKRVHPAGVSFSKIFKTQYNFAIVQPVKSAFSKACTTMSFSQIPLAQTFKIAVNGSDFEKALSQSIVMGDKTITIARRQVPNRLNSNQRHAKNPLHGISIGRQINIAATTSSKQSERADDMRRAHTTYNGYICFISSAVSGEVVGLQKQMAITASISESSSSDLMKEYVLGLPEVIPLAEVTPGEIHEYSLKKIFVNGAWMGLVEDPHLVCLKLRQARRRGEIDPYATIAYDVMVSEINVWVDVGRITRPLLIVYNNWDHPSLFNNDDTTTATTPAPTAATTPATEPAMSATPAAKSTKTTKTGSGRGKTAPGATAHSAGGATASTAPDQHTVPASTAAPAAPVKLDMPVFGEPLPESQRNPAKFRQKILLTTAHLDMLMKGQIGMDHLRKAGIIEYITPEEHENCMISVNVETLRLYQNNVNYVFTHCDIEQAIAGIPCLTSPYASHNQGPRIIYQTNQVKQAGGWFANNWPYRVDREAFLQHDCEEPLVRTIANNFMTPIGQHVVLAIASSTGYNQEDSLLVKKEAVDRSAFNGSHFTFEQAELEQGDSFGVPPDNITMDRKAYANYGKLQSAGAPREGTKIVPDDVLIGKYAEMPKVQNIPDTFKFVDKSVIYKGNEEVYVQHIVTDRNSDDVPFCKVALRSDRNVGIGDKFSSRSGQKGVVGIKLPEADMPFTSSGIIPDIVMNPHAIPSRMTIGQIIESLVGTANANMGRVTNGTLFDKVDLENVGDELERYGYNRMGTHRMMDGCTGEVMDVELFSGIVYMQRLQKFWHDSSYSVKTPVLDPITRQPLGGKSSGGGLRIGEMEKDVCMANGAMRFLEEKFFTHSDGFPVYICKNCGEYAIYNQERGMFKCNTKTCNGNEEIVKVKSSWSTKLLMQELNSINIGVKFNFEPPSIEEGN